MKRFKWLVFGSAILLVSSAQAQPPQGEEGPPHGPPPKNPIMEVLDADHDHVISAEEIAAAVAALNSLDANKDGQLTEDEFRPEFGGPPPRDGQPGERIGGPRQRNSQERNPPSRDRSANESGRPPAGRGGPPNGPPGPGGERPDGPPPRDPERFVDHVFEFDANNDGMLSRDELTRFAEQMPGPGMGPGGPGGQGRAGQGPGGPGGRPGRPVGGGGEDQPRPTRPQRPSDK